MVDWVFGSHHHLITGRLWVKMLVPKEWSWHGRDPKRHFLCLKMGFDGNVYMAKHRSGVGKCPNSISPNYWGYFISSRYLFRWCSKSPRVGTFTNPCHFPLGILRCKRVQVGPRNPACSRSVSLPKICSPGGEGKGLKPVGSSIINCLYGGFHKLGVPKKCWIMENPTKIDDLEVPLF